MLTVAGLGAATWGGVLAYRGANQASDARARLESAPSDQAWDEAKADFDAGKSTNQRGWTIAGVGAAAVVGGILLIATAPDKSSNVALRSWVTAGAGGLIVSGAF